MARLYADGGKIVLGRMLLANAEASRLRASITCAVGADRSVSANRALVPPMSAMSASDAGFTVSRIDQRSAFMSVEKSL